MRIKSDYDTHTKEELLSELEARKIEGFSMATNKPDMVAALALDDETGGQPKAPLPKLVSSGIPQLEKAEVVPEAGLDANAAPKDEEYTDGIFVEKASGQPFALCIHDANAYGKTHSLKNSGYFHQLTEEEFNAQFSKK